MLQSDIASFRASKFMYLLHWRMASSSLKTDKLTLHERNDLCNMQIECERMIAGYNSVLTQLQVNAR